MDELGELIGELLEGAVESKGCLKWLAILVMLGIFGFLVFKYVL